MDPEVEAMKTGYYDRWRDRELVVIERVPDAGWVVHWHMEDSIAPPSEYATKREAVARVMQLMQTGVVAPQTRPESVCVGTVFTEADPPASDALSPDA